MSGAEAPRTASIETARSLLFVPGDRPDRYERALAAGADLVVVDLEDAVAAEAKDAARARLDEWLGRVGARVVVRVNGVATPHHAADLELVRRHRLLGVILPKADLAGLASLTDVGRVPVCALVETATGVLESAAIAASPLVVRLVLGTVDLAAELGCAEGASPVETAGDLLVLASARAGLPAPVDGVCRTLSDPAEVTVAADRARRRGFGGKLAIHPDQVAAINDCFSPSAEELAWAQRVVDAGTDGVTVIDGAMVDLPVVGRARRLLGWSQ